MPEPHDPSSLDELMTAAQLAELLLVRKSTVEDYARRGLLPSLKLGRHRRFVRSDVIRAVDQLRLSARNGRGGGGPAL
jgi:excisionase family DNA binding protein